MNIVRHSCTTRKITSSLSRDARSNPSSISNSTSSPARSFNPSRYQSSAPQSGFIEQRWMQQVGCRPKLLIQCLRVFPRLLRKFRQRRIVSSTRCPTYSGSSAAAQSFGPRCRAVPARSAAAPDPRLRRRTDRSRNCSDCVITSVVRCSNSSVLACT